MRRNVLAVSSVFILALATIEACSPDARDIEDPVDTDANHDADRDVDAHQDAWIDLPTAEFMPGELLIQYEPGATEWQKVAARARLGAVVAERIHTGAMRRGGAGSLERVSLPPTMDVAIAARALGDAPGVAFAEPNYIYRHTADSNDPLYLDGDLWGTYGDSSSPANAFGSQAAEAWAMGHIGHIGNIETSAESNDVVVGIIDTGVDIDHEDLAANIWTNSTVVNGVGTDGNNFDNDIHGWDFFHNDNTVFDEGDGDSHGTHVAGTIGAVGGNGIGVAGVNWHVKMVVAKFLGPNGGTTANAVKAVDYMTGLKQSGVNLVATNNSWGGGGFSTALRNAIRRANTAGILFVAAAGNSRRNTDSSLFPHYPSGYSVDNVISVAAIDESGNLASFSNYGKKTVDLGAPGVRVLSTVPSDDYAFFSGTSMATPHVTGAIALRMTAAPPDPPNHLAVRDAILDTTIETPALQNKSVTGGRLDIASFLTEGL